MNEREKEIARTFMLFGALCGGLLSVAAYAVLWALISLAGGR